MSESLGLVTCGQVPTVPMQSVRLGGGALGFAFPKNRFILGDHEENLNTEAKLETEAESPPPPP